MNNLNDEIRSLLLETAVLEGLGFTTAHGINGCIKHLLSDQRMTLVKGNMTNRVSNPVALKHLIAELFPMSIARVVLISRGGFNDLVLESRKPVAREYRQWVTDEVLPALQDTGTFTDKKFLI